jgi:large subunit ribosomal protein L10
VWVPELHPACRAWSFLLFLAKGGKHVPTAEKAAAIAEIKERLTRAKSMVIAEYRGLNVQEITDLRRKSREAGVEYRVLKNTLTARAAREVDIHGLEPYLEGPNAFAFGYDDPVTPAKVLAEFAKVHDELVIKGGYLTGKVIDAQAVKALADLPSREVLLSQLLRGMQGPISGLANVLQGTIRNLVYALEAVRKQKEEAAQA